MDYIVKDSSLLPDLESVRTMRTPDSSIRMGIVRQEHTLNDGEIRYTVEVLVNGKQVPVSCVVMSKFGGAHNFEETTLRPWLNGFPSGALLPASADKYKARSGDVVLVAYLNGQSREGVILGCLSHPARKKVLTGKKIAYLSEFNGLETSITDDGSYKVTFKGYAPTNDATLKIPPIGTDIPPAIYNPLTGGSYYGFSSKGSFVASDGSQFLKIHKNLLSGSIILKSGSSQIELSGNPAIGTFGVKSGKAVMELSTTASIKSTIGLALQSLQVSIKGTQIAIGNDQFELIDGLIQLIDALGTLVVTSPVGTCTPLMSAPTWAAQVLPLKIKMTLIKGSLKDADSFSLSGDDDPEIDSNK
jgi:hypothetical protein